jgi:hypothetical protein
MSQGAAPAAAARAVGIRWCPEPEARAYHDAGAAPLRDDPLHCTGDETKKSLKARFSPERSANQGGNK